MECGVGVGFQIGFEAKIRFGVEVGVRWNEEGLDKDGARFGHTHPVHLVKLEFSIVGVRLRIGGGSDDIRDSG